MYTLVSDGWLNLLKPPGMTSHDVVAWVRRQARPSRPKVGHLGTLDPPASGILPLCLGKAARLSRFCDTHTKTYVFEIVFGIETDTLDYAGTLTRRGRADVAETDITAALPQFIGEINQTPPRFSAVHIAGARAYDLARRGEDIELPQRRVTIHSLAVVRFQPGAVLLEMTCSKGTYVRSVCADLCAVLGTVGHVGFLTRTAVGPFGQDNALTLEELADGSINRFLVPLDMPLGHLTAVRLVESDVRAFCVGTAIEYTYDAQEGTKPLQHEYKPVEGHYYRIYDEGGAFIGIGKARDRFLKPEVVLANHTPATAAGDEAPGRLDAEASVE